MRNKIKILIIFLAVAFTAQSCGLGPKNQGPEITLEWWKVFDDARQVEPLIDEFETTHPGVRIKFVEKNIETYEDELIDALAAGQGPDIFSIHNDWLPKHKDKLTAAPETIFGLRELQQNFAGVLETDLVADGQVYGLPLAMDVLALYYNKDLLSSAGIALPPSTWQEMVNIVPRLTRQDNLGNFQRSAVALGTADNINRAPDILSLLMLQNGTPVFSADGRGAEFDKDVSGPNGEFYSPGARALEFYTQFANPAKNTYTWNARSSNSIDAFAAGQVAMIFSYSYLAETLEGKAPFLNYAVARVPQLGGSDLRVNFANYWAESVSKQSKHPDAAWQFLKFITSREVLPKYYEGAAQVSPRLDIIEDQIADPQIGVFAENALSARSFYKPDNDAVENIFVQMINDVALRHVSVEDALRAAAQKINLLLRSQ